MTKETHFE